MLEWIQGIEKSLPVVKDIVEIIFAVVGASIAFLAYRAAKKTVLSPLKTEVLKLQLDAIKEVHDYITFNETKVERFDEFIGLREMWKHGVSRLTDQWYVAYCNSHKPQDSELALTWDDYCNAAHSKQGLTIPNTKLYRDNEFTGDMTLEQWNHIVITSAVTTSNFSNYVNKYESFASSPWLPEKLLELLKQYHEVLNFIPSTFISELNVIKEKYFNFKEFENEQLAYAYYTCPRTYWTYYCDLPLEIIKTKREEIQKHIREYLKVNDLMD